MKCYVVGFALLVASVLVCDVQARKWTDATGKYSVEAELVEVTGDTVVLKKPAGSVIRVPIARLSQADQEYLQLPGKPGQEPPDDGPAAGEAVANSIGMRLTLMPAGEFMMGSPDSAPDARTDEKPQHRVRITKPFYLGVTEVTQGQYEKVMGNNPSYFAQRGVLSGPDAPVEFVSWDDAQEFCRRLSESAEEKQAGRRYRLPTEAEWEYACRAGSAERFCCGDDESRLNDHAWYSKNSRNVPHPAGQKKPNAWGLYDMHGNVEEWCADWYDDSTAPPYFVVDYYAKSPTDDPTGPSKGQHRVYRGGCFSSPAGACRSACRNHSGPGGRVGTLGFRVCLTLEGAGAAKQKHVRQVDRQPAVREERPPEPAPAAKPPAWKPVWAADLAKMRIPEGTVSGKIHGKDFVLDAAELQNNVLTLRQGNDFWPDLALTIFVFGLEEGESVEGKKFRVTPKDKYDSPHIHVKWREKKGEGTPDTDMIMGGYAMILEFGKKQAGKIPGRIYASLPDKSRSVVAGTFTIVMADETSEPGTGEIGGKIVLRGPRPEGWIALGCLGKSPDGELENPGVGTKTDASSWWGTCMTWKPRNTTLRWDAKTGSGTHQHINRPPGHYLVYLRSGRSHPSGSETHYEGYCDSKWVELRDVKSAVVADLEIDPANVGILKVMVKGRTKESAVVYVPLDNDGQLPLAGAHYYFQMTSSAKLEDGKAVIRGLREGKYQVAMGPWQRGALGPDGKTALEVLPSVTADVEVKRGQTARVELTPPPAASTEQPAAPARKKVTGSGLPDLQVVRIYVEELDQGSTKASYPRALVKNAGTARAESIDVRFFVDGQSASISTGIVLNPGQEYVAGMQRLTPGTHVVKAAADPDNKIHESDETNNSKEATLSSPR